MSKLIHNAFRFFAASAVLALAAPSAQAALFVDDASVLKGKTADVYVERGDSSAPSLIKGTVADPNVAIFSTVAGDDDVSTLTFDATNIACFKVKGVGIGTTTITFKRGTTDEATITVTVKANPAGKSIETSTSDLFISEGAQDGTARVTITLGEAPTASKTFNITALEADATQHFTFPETITIPANSMSKDIIIKGLDGDYSSELSISDPDAEYQACSMFVNVTNIAPKIAISTDSDEPSVWGSAVVRNQGVVFSPGNIGASDVQADMNKLTYTFSFAPDQPIHAGETITTSFPSACPENEIDSGRLTANVSVTVSDGTAAVTGYIHVHVQESVTLYTDTTSPAAALSARGGVAEGATFKVTDPTGLAWTLFGEGVVNGRVASAPKSAVTIAPDDLKGAYKFAWASQDGADALKQSGIFKVPTTYSSVIVNLPEEGSITLGFYASYPYYNIDGNGAKEGLNTVWTDPFGDFDADGLSDVWEGNYLDDNQATTAEGIENLFAFAVANPNGDFGKNGNPDGDFLPTSDFEPAPDGKDKIGWPFEAEPGVTNRYLVYKYPLDFKSGEQSYNNIYGKKPAFDNFTEYRGLKEDRTGGDGKDPELFVAYAPEFVTKADRQDCPGTDPTEADTDGDGMTDGWEYYFWSTIKYEVNSANWRAYDPFFVYYSTQSAKAGIPLLSNPALPLDIAFDLTPTRGYYLSIPDGLYATSYTPKDKDEAKEALKSGVPMEHGSLTVTFADADPNFYLLTKPGLLTEDCYESVLYPVLIEAEDGTLVQAQVFNKDTNEWEPQFATLKGAWVNALTGEFSIPGWATLSALKGAETLTQDSVASVSWTRRDGLFPKSYLLARFDPMNWSVGPVITAEDVGYDKNRWDCSSDLDNDGVLDIEEYFLGTDPLHWDTDRDGMPDGWEVQQGFNPLSPLNGDGTGPNDNPDEDFMAGSGTYVHALSFLVDGFVPGRAATTGSPYSNLQEFLFARYGMICMTDETWTHPKNGWQAKGIYPSDWSKTTTSPVNNDTNGNGIPDGWEAYVGMDAISGVVQPMLLGLPMDDNDFDVDGLTTVQEFSCVSVSEKWPETRTFYIGPDAVNGTESQDVVGEDGSTNTVTTTTGSGTLVTINGFKNPFPEWTNKTLPTNPWSGDTDADGVADADEWTDANDANKDGIELANLCPTCADTDRDWLPDVWEYKWGTYWPNQTTTGASVNDPWGPMGDPDGDGLSNYQEYLTAANYGWRYDKWYRRDNAKNWIPQARMDMDPDYPYNPGLIPDLGPVVRAHEYDMMDFFRPAVPESVIDNGIKVLRTLEKRWGYTAAESPSIGQETIAAFIQRAYEIVTDVENFKQWIDPDVEAELFGYVPPVYALDQMHIDGKDYWTRKTGTSLTPEEFYDIVMFWEQAPNYLYSYGAVPQPWDPCRNNTPSGVMYTFLPEGYGTNPRSTDTDNDGMSDYWEIFHGLNPYYGGQRNVATKAGGVHDSDKSLVSDDWEMGNDYRYVQIQGFCLAMQHMPQPRAPHQWYDYDIEDTRTFDDYETTMFPCGACGYHMEAAHYDLVNRPWLSGDKSADCDKDGLSNQEEAYNLFAPDLLSHTDPTPYWMTDMSYRDSHVNLYYSTGSMGQTYHWWWEFPIDGNDACTDAPMYAWDFEINEGFDTDNDNIADRDEMMDTNGRGKTDPQNFDSPVSRKAMYFDGHAAMRTQRPFFHDMYALTSFTVEFWVRPEALPAANKEETILQRPVMMPVDSLAGNPGWAVRNTFHFTIDAEGRIRLRVDNDGIEQAASQVMVVSAGRVQPNTWVHVAAVMDSQKDVLTLYINGEVSSRVITSLKPCTGTMLTSGHHFWETAPAADGSTGTPIHSFYRVLQDGNSFHYGTSRGEALMGGQNITYDYSPAPIVIGAADNNPWGVVGLMNEPELDLDTCFHGWVDEVRIWDRCRSQDEIFNWMMKRATKDDIEPINHNRWAWDQQNLWSANATDNFPQKLLYHYSFDNMPDVLRKNTRGTTYDDLNHTDTDPVPNGWREISSIRPIGYIPWWYGSAYRSAVYGSDYAYIPFAENTVSHLPQYPSRDIKELIPIYDEGFNLAGYRYRLSADWADKEQDLDTYGIVQPDVEINMGEDLYEGDMKVNVEVDKDRIVNTMDPYGDVYMTAHNGTSEVNPWNFAGMIDWYGVYENVPVHSDLLPLMDAVADFDVPMWDGKGEGWDYSTIDSDGDGLPDWWEIAHGLDPNSSEGLDGAYGDPDGDGLDNYAEYQAQTNPQAYDTDSDGYSDYFSRADGSSLTYGELYDDSDGMDNSWEMAHGLDPNRYDATEDHDADGWTNYEEFMARTDPSDPQSYPKPKFSVTFDYDGEQFEAENLVVYAYGEKTTGVKMGGHWDGRYLTALSSVGGDGVLGEDGPYSCQGVNWVASKLPMSNVDQLTVAVALPDGTVETLTASDFNPEIKVLSATDAGYLFVEIESGMLLATGMYEGLSYTVQNLTSTAFAFPRTYRNMIRDGEGRYTHMVSGKNRFFGFMDVNGDLEYTAGEPAGLALYRPTTVNWDAVEIEIPLTDTLWGYPRLLWEPSPYANTEQYQIRFGNWIKVPKGTKPEEEEEEEEETEFKLDEDGDGLDIYAEGKAGTDPTKSDTAGNGYSDYYTMATTGAYAGKLMNGEAFDDGDGIPSDWEMKYGTEASKYDADWDDDDDGWTNYEEYMAGTNPKSDSSFPTPKLAVSLTYDGEQTAESFVLGAFSDKKMAKTLKGAGDVFWTGTLNGHEEGNLNVLIDSSVLDTSKGWTGRNHLVSGNNRFFAYMDVNGNGTFDTGEPAGVSKYRPTAVSWDAVKVDIPLTDEQFGYPRLSWMSTTNSTMTHYKVVFSSWTTSAVEIEVPITRSYLTELDFVNAGVNGLDLGATSQDVSFDWTVTACNGWSADDEVITNGTFKVFPGPAAGRRAMKALYPLGGEPVYGSLAEFRWQMDWRTQGVKVSIKNASGTEVLSKTVSFPELHGKRTDANYYYSSIPQLEGGADAKFVNLPSGTYTYTITEILNTTGIAKKSVSGTFKMVNDDSALDRYSVSGEVFYFGRIQNGSANFPANLIIQAWAAPDEAKDFAALSGVPVAQTVQNKDGTFKLTGLSAGKYVLRGFLDTTANGKCDEGETQGFVMTKGTAGPVLDRTSRMISVGGTNNVTDVVLVLHDRDTNEDKIPDSWKDLHPDATLASYSALPLKDIAGLPYIWEDSAKGIYTKTSSSSSSSTTISGGEGGGDEPGEEKVEYEDRWSNFFTLYVDAPRTFLHEGDILRQGHLGIDFLETAKTNTLTWIASPRGNTNDVLGTGTYVVEDMMSNRRTMSVVFPRQFEKVYGSTVQFQWNMDTRNTGVHILIRDYNTKDVVLDRTVPFPVRHGKASAANSTYTSIPQMADTYWQLGAATDLPFLSLPSGIYEYTILECQPLNSAADPQSITETFQLVNDDSSTETFSVSGTVQYFGKVMTDVETGTFAVPLVIQAFRMPEDAASCTAPAGSPIAEAVQTAKGDFKISGLRKGKYAVRGFLDSNGNGLCDAWETQGVAVQSGSVSPVVSSGSAPLEIKSGNVVGTLLVLHDRDTDNDLLPDAWEYLTFGDLATSGYEQKSAGVYLWEEYADGPLDSDPRTPDTDLDGLTDAMEILLGTNTHSKDTDGDGVSDLEEFLAGSDPCDPAQALRYTMPGLVFDKDGVPTVECAYPALKPGVILTYELWRTESLSQPEWKEVAFQSVGATDDTVTYGSDGVSSYTVPGGTFTMKPADQAEGIDLATGFYRVKVFADYGKMVDNGDGTWSYWTWINQGNNRWVFTEAAKGEGTLVRDAQGNWMFVEDASSLKSGSLYRSEDGTWSFIR